jgi:hypothetical protein
VSFARSTGTLDMTTIRKRILKRASTVGFVDPITNLPPVDECSLSALLCFYHHTGNIDWNQVPLRLSSDPTMTGDTVASLVFTQPGFISCEYPLIWETEEQKDERGSMRPDLVFLSDDQSTVVIIENKIGAAVTHKGDKYGGQFGRYIKYLMASHIERRYMVLLTSTEYIQKTKPWYTTELQHAENSLDSRGKVSGVVIVWEDVFKAFAFRQVT